MLEIRAHYRPTTDDFPLGIYRVVGTNDPVALLRVADADGRRCHTGHLERVPRSDLDDYFEPADDPDTGLDPIAGVRNAFQGLYWQFRKFF
jgi:hypothetical protein